MYVHGEGVELSQTAQVAQQQDHQATPLNSLDGAGQQVGSKSLKVLQCSIQCCCVKVDLDAAAAAFGCALSPAAAAAAAVGGDSGTGAGCCCCRCP